MFEQAVLLAVCCAAAVNGLGYTREITVEGTLMCQGRFVYNSQVCLYERDKFDPDDLIDETKSSAKGFFSVTGNETEIGTVEFYLLVRHTCYRGIRNSGCNVTDVYEVPVEYLGTVYKMDIVSLDIAQSKHSAVCSPNAQFRPERGDRDVVFKPKITYVTAAKATTRAKTVAKPPSENSDDLEDP